MSKVKLRLVFILVVAALAVLISSIVLGALPLKRVFAAEPTYSPSDIFESVSGASVGASEAEGDETSYMQFTLPNEGKVEYRRDLALKWFEASDAPSDKLANPGEAKFFSMSFAFDTIVFEKLTVTFQSAEEHVTKEGQTTNAIVFEYKDSVLTVCVHDSDYDEEDESAPEIKKTTIPDAKADLYFSLEEDEEHIGEFRVMLKQGAGAAEEIGTFTNIGGYFLEYRSSAASSPQVPVTFEAENTVSAGGASEQNVFMKSLNGQTFELKDGFVTDNAKPVVVINEKIYSLRLGQRFSLSYEVMDVCRSSVTADKQYYMLKQTEDEEGELKYVKPSKEDYSELKTSTFFLPTDDNNDEELAYVSIRFRLSDSTFKDYYVYLTWYADMSAENVIAKLGDEGYETTSGYTCSVCGYECSVAEYEKLTAAGVEFKCPGMKKVPVKDENNEETGETEEEPCDATVADYEEKIEGNFFDYIVVNREAEGPVYLGVTRPTLDEVDKGAKPENDATAAQQAVAEYQEEVNKAAEKVSAGEGAYFYLPSLRALIGSQYADYRNLRFNIYYYKPSTETGGTATSATSLRYNNLRFEVDEQGYYKFRVIAQDASGNSMKYYNEDGDLVTLNSGNVWDIEGIPEFTFYMGYDGPTINESGTQDEGKRDQMYTISNFEIVALAGYDTDYKLYRFDNTKLPEDKTVSYSELVEKVDEAKDDLENFEDGWLWDCLVEIRKYDPAITEKDDKWDDSDNAYAWDPDSSLSFRPQVSTYYIVQVTVTDGVYPDVTATAFKVIDIGATPDVILVPNNWLKNNTTSVILFAIAAVLLVVIVLLFVIKPSEKNVEEVDLATLKGKKKKDKK